MAEDGYLTVSAPPDRPATRRAPICSCPRTISGWRIPPRLAPGTSLAGQVCHRYFRACLGYVPKPSAFPLVHLRTTDRPQPLWTRVSSNFTERILPGDHESCVTDHLGVLARALREV